MGFNKQMEDERELGQEMAQRDDREHNSLDFMSDDFDPLGLNALFNHIKSGVTKEISPNVCMCKKCEATLLCEHSKDEPHQLSVCGNCG